jgi:hypothetical protein
MDDKQNTKTIYHKRTKFTRRQIVGAVLSTVMACLCMYGLYSMAFPVDTTDQTALESAINDYFSTENVEVAIRAQQKTGRHIVVFYERKGYRGHYGIANLEKGLFGKSRFLDANLRDWPLYSYGYSRDKNHLLLYGINDLQDVAAYAIYPADDTSAEPIYRGEAETGPFLHIIELGHPEDYIGNQFVHYYDENGNELDFNALWKEAPQPEEGRTHGVGTAELGMPYVLIGIVFVIGIVLVRYFLTT